MNTKLKTRESNHTPVENHAIELRNLKPVNDERIHEAPTKKRSFAKTVFMLFAAPFIALAYVVAAPLVGIYLIVKLALEVYAKRSLAINGRLRDAATQARNIGLFFAAPFIALAYAIAFPFIGLFMLSKLAIEANTRTR